MARGGEFLETAHIGGLKKLQMPMSTLGPDQANIITFSNNSSKGVRVRVALLTLQHTPTTNEPLLPNHPSYTSSQGAEFDAYCHVFDALDEFLVNSGR